MSDNIVVVMIDKIKKGFRIFRRRLDRQGLYITLLWIYGRGLPLITGKPILRFSEVTPSLFVGPQYRRNGLEYLKNKGIRAVVNLRIEKDDARLGIAPERYCYLPTVDDDAPTIQQLIEGIAFIEENIQQGQKVYIHCGAGVGRAPTLAAAYLVSTGLSLDEALRKIRKVRPFIWITPLQMQALKSFERTPRG